MPAHSCLCSPQEIVSSAFDILEHLRYYPRFQGKHRFVCIGIRAFRGMACACHIPNLMLLTTTWRLNIQCVCCAVSWRSHIPKYRPLLCLQTILRRQWRRSLTAGSLRVSFPAMETFFNLVASRSWSSTSAWHLEPNCFVKGLEHPEGNQVCSFVVCYLWFSLNAAWGHIVDLVVLTIQ